MIRYFLTRMIAFIALTTASTVVMALPHMM